MKFILNLILLVFFTSLFLPSSLCAAEGEDFLRKSIEVANAREGSQLAEYSLINQDGEAFKVSQLLGKPLLVTFVYTTCPDICSTIAATLAPSIEEVRKELGEDTFNTLIVGFDYENDTPEMLNEFGVHHGIDFNTVTLGSGNEETINRLTRDLGFYYEIDENDVINHIGLVTVIDQTGKVYRQVYGTKIDARALKGPVEQLLTGNVLAKKRPTFIDKVKVLCLKYDPETGEYTWDYAYLFGVFLQAMVLILIPLFYFQDNIKNSLKSFFKKKKSQNSENF